MSSLLKFITCGSVDDGKSTLIGHILYDAKLLYTDQEEALALDSKVGSRGGDIDYSLLLDGLMAEREQGITIDVAYRYFTTDKRSFIVADTPGHEEYTRNMAVGASFADLAVILLDATQGVLVQTRRHARICALMGIWYFVFAVNKMDLADYSKETFDRISGDIDSLSEELGLLNRIIIPVSATQGDNVTTRSEHMPWYEGPSVLEHLEDVTVEHAHQETGFYLPVQRVCRPDHTFRGFQGQVESGTVHVGDVLTVLPSGQTGAVTTILVGNQEKDSATVGQPVTISLDKEVDISRGCVLKAQNTIGTARDFDVSLLWMDDAELTPGKAYFVKLGTKRIAGKVRRIRYRTDINTGEQLPASTLSKNEIALCELHLDEAIPVDLFQSHRTLGELILIDRLSNMTAACGVVEEIYDEDDGEHSTVFKGDGLKARLSLFEEYCYNEKSAGVDNVTIEPKTYSVGDTIPLNGESFDYPENFDIILVKARVVASIREGVIESLSKLSDYKFSGLPLVNGKGFSIAVGSSGEFAEFLSDIDALDRQELYRKWMRFETYRTVIFTSNYWEV